MRHTAVHWWIPADGCAHDAVASDYPVDDSPRPILREANGARLRR